MPLGKLSKKQIESAYKVLSEALELIKLDKKPGGGEAPGSTAAVNVQLLDCSNRFYTLIPHDFGMKKPPLLDDLDLIKVSLWVYGFFLYIMIVPRNRGKRIFSSCLLHVIEGN